VKLLLDYGANSRAKDKKGISPLKLVKSHIALLQHSPSSPSLSSSSSSQTSVSELSEIQQLLEAGRVSNCEECTHAECRQWCKEEEEW
jgi:hypothetical protein